MIVLLRDLRLYAFVPDSLINGDKIVILQNDEKE